MENKKPKYTFIEREILRDIADSIRSGKGKTREEMPLKPTEFKGEIDGYLDSFRGTIDGRELDLVIPSGITQIADYTFHKNTNIKSVIISEGVKTIGLDAFSNSTKLEKVVISNSVTDVGHGAFYNCSKLKDLTLGNSIENIGTYAFYTVPISKLVFPDSVKVIGVNAFRGCSVITNTTFGKGLTTIESEAFWDCAYCSLYDFSKCESVPTLANKNAFGGWEAVGNRKIIVPAGLYYRWRTEPNWSESDIVSLITYPEGKIPFTIGSIYNGYEADEGMTWRKWVNSVGKDYGYTVTEYGVIAPVEIAGNEGYSVCTTDNGYTPVLPDDTIREYHYTVN